MSDNKVISIEEFYGGESSDSTIGPKASFGPSQAIEFRRDPSNITVLPGPRRIGEGVVNDLIINIVQSRSGNRYGLGHLGNIYAIDTSNTVTYFGKISDGTDGMYLSNDSPESLYMASLYKFHRYGPTGNTSGFTEYGPTKSIDSRATRSGGTQTCSAFQLSGSTNEVQRSFSFQPDIEPFYSIKVNVADKGGGDWAYELHDGANNVLASAVILNADVSNGWNEFVFANPVRANVKPNAGTYHLHIWSGGSNAKLVTTTADDMSTADFELWAYRFIATTNGLHPVAQFQQFICIGNGRYLSVWEPLTLTNPPNNEFQRHRLVFPVGYEVCGLATTDEFLVIACEKLASNSDRDFQDGKLFLWDGTSQTYNQIIDVPEGSPQGLYTYNNLPYFITNGALYAWPGGKNIVKVRTLANTNPAYKDATDTSRVYPNTMAIRDNILHFGFPSASTDPSIKRGVYTWGALEKNYPSTFGYSYIPSHGKKYYVDGAVSIGCVRNFGDEMYISWRDGNTFGLDIVDSFCDPAPEFKFRALEFTAGSKRKTKEAYKIAVDTDALPESVTITPVHSIDGAAEVTHENMVEGDTEKIVSIERGRYKRITFGFDGTCEGTDAPVIRSTSLEWNPLPGERVI